MSIDQELTKKAYSDYSNLDGGILSEADTTYRNDFTYYGYFDPGWCYTYKPNGTNPNQSYFSPETAATAHQCAGTGTKQIGETGAWSGNFLNWVSMTRMDILRRVLFGGMRSVDTTAQTILERAYIPSDVHAFVKVYSGTDIDKYTPYKSESGSEKRSFCNVSTSSDATGYPIIRTAANTDGYFYWSSLEGRQCRLGVANTPSSSSVSDMTAKVEVCVTGKDNARCKKYGTSTLLKPVGLLQKHGESGAINFSLTTGSYKSHLKGGILRKAASPLVDTDDVKHDDPDDEINLDDGTFNNQVSGIIKNISSFRIANFNSSATKYTDCNAPGISINTVLGGTTSGQTCTDWGNPIAETYLEMLRYVSGKSGPSSGFNVDDTTTLYDSNNAVTINGVPGLTRVSSWTDPWVDSCAKCAAIIISTGGNSFDGDDLSSASDIVGLSAGTSAVEAKTDAVGEKEYTSFAGNYYMGMNKSLYAPYTATAKPSARNCQSIYTDKLSSVSGICPELPGLEGTYNIAGLAYHAHTTDLRPGLAGDQTVTTYAVDLAESLPVFSIPVETGTVTFSPACEASGNGNYQSCTLINAVIERLTFSNNKLVAGSIVLTWEDSTWGNDNDLDATQRIEFCVGAACTLTSGTLGSDVIRITTTTLQAQAGFEIHLSYSLYGASEYSGKFYTGATQVTADNFYRSGTLLTASRTVAAGTAFAGGLVPWTVRPGNVNYDTLAGSGDSVESSMLDFKVTGATSATKSLPKPLWLAAKYGGFSDSNNNHEFDSGDAWDVHGPTPSIEGADGIPDNFFSVKNPSNLEENLNTIITDIVARSGSASAVATSSTRLTTDGYVYQAAFNSKDWTGELRGYQPDSATGELPSSPTKTTAVLTTPTSNDMQTTEVGRNIYTYVGSNTVEFKWTNLDSDKKNKLTFSGESLTTVENRVNWIRGSAAHEGPTGFRVREYTTKDANGNLVPYRNILGDIVNSSPVYEGEFDFRYSYLPTGGSTYATFVRDKRARASRVFVGANDGMLHAFKGKDTSSGQKDALRELFAYIPNMVYDKLPNLSKPDYGTIDNPHQYIVDGSIVVGDAYFSGAWHSIVVGSLGAGGKGIYVLDVTNAVPRVLFEYTHPDMGYVLGKIFLVPTKDGRWSIIFGNGDFTGTTSKLFMVDLEDPTNSDYTQIIDTGAGSGLSSPSIIINALGQLEDVYSGDIDGNMWHFYYSSTSPLTMSSYKVFSALSGQTITASPTIGFNNILKKNMVYFGTGRYYKTGDNLIGGQRQSFYAVPDNGPTGTPTVRSGLLEKTMTTSYTVGSESRTISTDPPNWTTQFGWYIDLDFDFGVRDERVTTKALLLQDMLYINTLLPNSIPCDVGGKSWFMEIPAVGDKSTRPPKGEFKNEVYLSDTSVALKTIPPSSSSSSSTTSSGSSSSSSAAADCTTDVELMTSGSGGGLNTRSRSLEGCNTGRQSWRQLK